MEYLETPKGKEGFNRLRQMLKNDNPAEKSIQGVAGDFGQNIVKKDKADFPVFANWDFFLSGSHLGRKKEKVGGKSRPD